MQIYKIDLELLIYILFIVVGIIVKIFGKTQGKKNPKLVTVTQDYSEGNSEFQFGKLFQRDEEKIQNTTTHPNQRLKRQDYKTIVELEELELQKNESKENIRVRKRNKRTEEDTIDHYSHKIKAKRQLKRFNIREAVIYSEILNRKSF